MEVKTILNYNAESEAASGFLVDSNNLHKTIVRLTHFANTQAPDDYCSDSKVRKVADDVKRLLELQEKIEERNEIMQTALRVFRPSVKRERRRFVGGYIAGIATMIVVSILLVLSYDYRGHEEYSHWGIDINSVRLFYKNEFIYDITES